MAEGTGQVDEPSPDTKPPAARFDVQLGDHAFETAKLEIVVEGQYQVGDQAVAALCHPDPAQCGFAQQPAQRATDPPALETDPVKTVVRAHQAKELAEIGRPSGPYGRWRFHKAINLR